ncbi:hypothetical protein QAD02_021611 [Eretmocerus hayati]|uniref:Uncharacterized protein n=1 Tax=Eretmocerus hayati TaxID=131215 RepID=A0ACC2PRT1_9HYME|nr:hypothetical protein QAD02_021611 [Eretmocerus hayati]
MTQKTVRECFVPRCVNRTNNPDKIFFYAPKDPVMRKKWFESVGRSDFPLSTKSDYLCCSDHFSLKDDMDNYLEYSMMGSLGMKSLKRLKKDAVPHHCGTSGASSPRSYSQSMSHKSTLHESQIDIQEQFMLHVPGARSPQKRVALGYITNSPDRMKSISNLLSPKKRSIPSNCSETGIKRAKVGGIVYDNTRVTSQGKCLKPRCETCEMVPLDVEESLLNNNEHNYNSDVLESDCKLCSLEDPVHDETCTSDFFNKHSTPSELFRGHQTTALNAKNVYTKVMGYETETWGNGSLILVDSNSRTSVSLDDKSTQTESSNLSEHQHPRTTDQLSMDDSQSMRVIGIQVKLDFTRPHYRSTEIQCELRSKSLDQCSQCHHNEFAVRVDRACSPSFGIPREPIQPRLSETSSSVAGSTPRSTDEYQPSQSTHSEH